MVRRCVVPACSSTDLTTLVHRFPRKHCTTWQTSLQLNSYSVKDLLEKYVVCAHHFRISDYRHRESKHLNTTAIPTLDVIPETDKIPEVQTDAAKGNKRQTAVNVTNVVVDGEPFNSTSSVVLGKTQTYSNCVTLSSSAPVAKIADLNDSVVDSDVSIENNFYSDCDIIEEEETDMDEEMFLDSNVSEVCTNDLPKYDAVTELFVEDVDGTYLENASIVEEIAVSCDNDASMEINDRLTNYVELIETNEDNEESDDECELNDEKEILFKDFTRKELIAELLAARSRIIELETKLGNIQEAHLSMIQNLNNFNKVLIS